MKVLLVNPAWEKRRQDIVICRVSFQARPAVLALCDQAVIQLDLSRPPIWVSRARRPGSPSPRIRFLRTRRPECRVAGDLEHGRSGTPLSTRPGGQVIAGEAFILLAVEFESEAFVAGLRPAARITQALLPRLGEPWSSSS